MQMLHFQGTLPGAAIYAARYAHELVDESGTNSYYINGYCSYYFQFSDHNINTNDFNDTLGHFTVQLADIP